MSSQPPYGNYPSQNQPWPEQPPDPSYPGYEQPVPSAYPPPPSYGAPPYPSQQGQPPALPTYSAPNVYMQPAPYPYGVPIPVAPPDPGSGQAVTSLVLGILSTVFAFIPCFGLISFVLGIIGLIMGIFGRKSVTRHGNAVAGIVLSSIGLGLSVLFFILWIGLNVISLSLPPAQ